MTIAECLKRSDVLLPDSDSARRDMELLLMQLLDKPRSFLYAYPDTTLQTAQAAQLDALLARRAAGEPMAYILGVRAFRNLRLQVTPAVLIPRPETELLVERVIAQLPRAGRVLDLGTGSGAVALAIADERRDAQVTAVEQSAAALAVAVANGERLKLPVRFLQGDWFAPVANETFDAVVSNPPYIDADDVHLQQGDVRAEPRSALIADDHGFGDLYAIADAARAHLAVGGCLLMEHGYTQAAALADRLRALGYHAVQTHTDAAGHDRVTGGIWRGHHAH
ncbi:MAG TPA: peptide chain release factor N(5)-glutamine methyltransferase [Pseudomonadales bacterium]